MSLHEYFHCTYNNPIANKTNRIFKKIRIPIYSGAKCEPVYPATVEYARGVMLIHCPWHGKFDIDKDSKLLMSRFNSFLNNPAKCPKSVMIAYERARLLYHAKEPTSISDELNYNNFSVAPDKETSDLVDLASSIYEKYSSDMDVSDFNYDFGIDYDWSQRHFEVSQKNC